CRPSVPHVYMGILTLHTLRTRADRRFPTSTWESSLCTPCGPVQTVGSPRLHGNPHFAHPAAHADRRFPTSTWESPPGEALHLPRDYHRGTFGPERLCRPRVRSWNSRRCVVLNGALRHQRPGGGGRRAGGAEHRRG